jgi:type II secretory pathway component PulK
MEGGSVTVGYSYLEDGVPRMRYGLQDEESKMNLNKAEEKVISRLLETVAGLSGDEALELAYRIVDWRDADSFFQHPLYGAEDSDYRDLSTPYECKDEPFEVLEELLLVKGMDREIFDQIKDFITVYAENALNINTVSPEVLQAYGLSESLIKKILSFRAGQDKIEGTVDDNVFTQAGEIVARLSQGYDLSPSEVAELSNFTAQVNPVTVSEYFMIRSQGRLLKKNQEAQIDAVVSGGGQIRYWREAY